MNLPSENRWSRYWYMGEVAGTRLVALRWVLFGLVAYDLWTVMLQHASRYGVGGFNVAQVGLLDQILPLPNPSIISFIVLLTGFFCALAVCGVWTRLSITISAIGYFGVYLWSQADSYQHHYLVGLLMFICCFVPTATWHATTPQEKPRWHWAIQLIYVQIAIVYFWTAITKLDPIWFTGITLDQIAAEPQIRAFMSAFESRLSLDPGQSYRFLAVLIVLGEFFAALVFMIPKLRLAGLFIVPWFHVSVELLGVDIELFSYYMIGLNLVLLSPPSVWRLMDDKSRTLALFLKPFQAWPSQIVARLAACAATALLAGYAVHGLPFEWATAFTITMVICAILLVTPWSKPRRGALSAVLVVGCALALPLTIKASESAYDFYRMWGGDLRRRGEIAHAAHKYEQANTIKQTGPSRRLQLGRLYDRLGRSDEALTQYRAAVARLEAYVGSLKRRANASPDSGPLQIEIAENQLRLMARCRALTTSLNRQGQTAEAATANDCTLVARLGAKDALNRALQKLPVMNLAEQKSVRQIQRQLRKK
jgi:tetratricopeptide (TPR) repeat protein